MNLIMESKTQGEMGNFEHRGSEGRPKKET